mgnify:FL=1
MYLVTGGAGFIGYHIVNKIISQDKKVIIIDNINNFSNKKIKEDRIKKLLSLKENFLIKFYNCDILNLNDTEKVFKLNKITKVIHLAAIPGIISSTDNSHKYIENNIVGFNNILYLSKKYNVERVLYASSSSVYDKTFKSEDKFEKTEFGNTKSIYSFTKKANEILAQTYSNLYDLNTIGLRFFSVYGPYGRPDMSYYKFTDALFKSMTINLNNSGKNIRDFTYISDLVDITMKICDDLTLSKFEIFNIGANNPISITDLLSKIENLSKRKAKINYCKKKIEEEEKTIANNKKIKDKYGIESFTEIDDGLKKFINWYVKYNKIKNV